VFQESTGIGSYGESSSLMGHVTIIQKNPQGDILSYQQYDNIIVNEGLNCITQVAFATANATCAAGTSTDQFDNVALLGSNPAPVAEDTAASGLVRLTGGRLTATTLGGDGVTTTQGKSITAIQHTFTKTNATAATVGGATLQNGAGDAIFAAKAFGGGDLTLNESDTLEITWTIQLGA